MPSTKRDDLVDILCGQKNKEEHTEVIYKSKRIRGWDGKYKPEYCESLIYHMGRGFDFETFTVEVNVAVCTLYEWIKKHPEFAIAYEVARAAHKMFYQRLLIRNAKFNKGNSSSAIFLAKNKLGYTDKTEIDLSQQSLVVTAQIGGDGQIIKKVTAQSDINNFLTDVLNEGYTNESTPNTSDTSQ